MTWRKIKQKISLSLLWRVEGDRITDLNKVVREALPEKVTSK